MPRANPRPSAASARALELLTAAPDMGTEAVLSQLAREGLACSPSTVTGHLSQLPAGARAAHRLACTRALLRSLAGVGPEVELTATQRAAVAEKLDVHRQFIGRAWKQGTTPAMRARWSVQLSSDISGIPVASLEPPG